MACAAPELAPVACAAPELAPVASRVAEFVPVACVIADTPACGEVGWIGEEVGEVPSLTGGGGELTLGAPGLADLKEESCCL